VLIDEQRFRHDCRNGLIRHPAVDIEVLLMKNPNDLIDGIPVDKQPGEPGLGKGFCDFLVALVDVHGFQLNPVGQNFRRRQVGLIYQFYNLIPVLNVIENMTLPVLMDGQKVNNDRLNELLNTLKLKGRENHLPNQLSGGQQQRVSIGRALMNAPAVVLADEPTGNLDSKNSQEIMELLKMSNQKYNQALVIITHDENIALQADRIIAIEDGKVKRDEVIRK